jgi:prepilin-type N-terminal cleavage/methylation domain-containing protein
MGKRWAPWFLGEKGMDFAGFITKMRRKADKRDMDMKAKKNPRGNQQGFTITEMLIVLILIAIITGIAYGAFHRMAINSNLRTAARDIASDFALLKQRAMAESRMYQLTVTIPGSYTLEQCTTQDNPCPSWTKIQVKNLSDFGTGIIFTGTTSPTLYSFQARGTATAGTIDLTNSRNSTATVSINATGRASVAFVMQ